MLLSLFGAAWMPSSACECWTSYHCVAFTDNAIVFVGTAIGTPSIDRALSYFPPMVFRVDNPMQGLPAKTQLVAVDTGSVNSCGANYQQGHQYLIVAGRLNRSLTFPEKIVMAMRQEHFEQRLHSELLFTSVCSSIPYEDAITALQAFRDWRAKDRKVTLNSKLYTIQDDNQAATKLIHDLEGTEVLLVGPRFESYRTRVQGYGRFIVPGLREGTYALRILHPTIHDIRANVQITNPERACVRADFYVKPLASPAPKPAQSKRRTTK